MPSCVVEFGDHSYLFVCKSFTL